MADAAHIAAGMAVAAVAADTVAVAVAAVAVAVAIAVAVVVRNRCYSKYLSGDVRLVLALGSLLVDSFVG